MRSRIGYTTGHWLLQMAQECLRQTEFDAQIAGSYPTALSTPQAIVILPSGMLVKNLSSAHPSDQHQLIKLCASAAYSGVGIVIRTFKSFFR